MLAAVVGGGLLAWGALSDGDPQDELAATSPSPISTAGTRASGGPLRDIPQGEYPAGFIAFVEQMDAAMLNGDAYFFTAVGENAHTPFDTAFICSPPVFPAAGPNCVETTPNPVTGAVGLLGISLGLLQSEGDVLDVLSYSKWVDDYLTNVDPNGSDKFGGSSPSIYAIADADPLIEGERPGQQTYAIVTTRIAGPLPEDQRGDAVILSAPEFRRQVVVFFVTYRDGGWGSPACCGRPSMPWTRARPGHTARWAICS